MAISLAHKAITVDINSRNAPNLVAIANVNDKATRYLDVTLTASGKKLSFAGCTATATFVTEGILISDEVVCTLNSAADVITVPLDDLKSTAGFLSIEIKIKNGETQVLNTPLALKVQITPSLTEGSKINKDSVGTTAEICREVAAARGNYADLNTRITADETNLENKANTADVETVKSEITSARGEYDNLGQRLDTLIDGNEQGQVDTFNLAEGAVTAEIIADRAITLSKLSIELLAMLNTINNKADKATTLDGYGITDAYTKTTVKTLLAGKLDAMSFDSEPKLNSPCYLTSGTVYNALLAKADKNAVDTALTSKANLVNSSNIFDFDAWAKELQKLNQPVFHGTLDELNFDEKSITFTATEKDAYTNSWMLPRPESMKISVKPNTKYWVYWLTNNYDCNTMVFLNGIHTDGTFVTIKNGKGTFVTNNDTSFITIRFGSYNYGTFKISEIMITEKESIYLPNKVAEGVTEVADEVFAFEKTTQTSLDKKYDSSNVENGKGTLTPAQAIYDGFEGSFNYSKIGKTVTVALNITTLIAGKNYVQFAGLPFKAMTASKLSSIAVYTTANKLVNLRLDGSGLYVSSPGTTFADGEKINAIITYIIG